MTSRAFAFAPARWLGHPALSTATALAALVGIVMGGKLAALALASVLYGDALAITLTNRQDAGDAALMAQMIVLLSAQAAMVALTIAVASASGRHPVRLLRLQPPAGGLRDYLWGGLAFAGAVLAVNLGLLLLQPVSFMEDLELYFRLVRSQAFGVATIAITVGAPLSEELLFRGLLLPALASTRLGFAGAAIVSTMVWTAMHLCYSIAGLVEVAIFGLVLSWLLWRTDSLRVPLFCHALYNALLLAVVWLLGAGS